MELTRKGVEIAYRFSFFDRYLTWLIVGFVMVVIILHGFDDFNDRFCMQKSKAMSNKIESRPP